MTTALYICLGVVIAALLGVVASVWWLLRMLDRDEQRERERHWWSINRP